MNNPFVLLLVVALIIVLMITAIEYFGGPPRE